VSYLKKPTLSQQQDELRVWVDERLSNEAQGIRQRVSQWLLDNQYFVDNELFDFYFCVAQNIAAVEVLGGSGEKIVKAKMELEESAEAYTTQVVDVSHWINEQLQSQLQGVQRNQQKLDTKLVQVLEGLSKEHQNLKAVSTGLVNSTSVLLKKQQQLVIQTQEAIELTRQSVIIAWIVPVITLFGLIALIILNHQL
jgi:transcription termination factor NusB